MWKIRNESGAVKAVYDSVCDKNTAQRGDEHAAILDALRNHDSAAGRTAMRNHFGRLIEVMLDITEEQSYNEMRKKSDETRERFLKSV